MIRRSDAIKAVAEYISCDYATEEMATESATLLIDTIPTIEVEEMDSTEIAKMVVHKMIENTTFAEDAYPDIKQKMHDAIENAPIVETKHGEWNKPNYGQCSNFRGWAIETENGYYFSDFCPHCGAEMKGADDD